MNPIDPSDLTFYDEWRAVGIDVDTDGVESREEGCWVKTKSAVRSEAADLRREAGSLAYDRIIIERRWLSPANVVGDVEDLA